MCWSHLAEADAPSTPDPRLDCSCCDATITDCNLMAISCCWQDHVTATIPCDLKGIAHCSMHSRIITPAFLYSVKDPVLTEVESGYDRVFTQIESGHDHVLTRSESGHDFEHVIHATV